MDDSGWCSLGRKDGFSNKQVSGQRCSGALHLSAPLGGLLPPGFPVLNRKLLYGC